MTARGNAKPDGSPTIKTAAVPEFQLRPACETDFAFTKRLYMASMRPLLEALDAWDEDKAAAAFGSYFKLDEIRIVTVSGVDVGWIQVSETGNELHLDQIHLLQEFRNLGLGSRLIRDTMAGACAKGKPVLLSLIRGNRAVKLYERLGFRLTGRDRTKFHMYWEGE